MNINEEIQKATDKFVEEKLPILVEEKVGKMVEDILSDTFKSWSDIGKSIKQRIEEKLDINLQKYDLIDYNAMVSKAINDKLIGLVNENSIEPIMEMIKETVGFIEKKEITLSEIHEIIIEHSMTENEDETEGEISFHVTENANDKWITVSMDLEKDVDKKDCGLEFLIGTTHGKIFMFKTNDYFSKKGEITPIKMSRLSKAENKIFRLFSANVTVKIDTMYFDNSWSRYH